MANPTDHSLNMAAPLDKEYVKTYLSLTKRWEEIKDCFPLTEGGQWKELPEELLDSIKGDDVLVFVKIAYFYYSAIENRDEFGYALDRVIAELGYPEDLECFLSYALLEWCGPTGPSHERLEKVYPRLFRKNGT